MAGFTMISVRTEMVIFHDAMFDISSVVQFSREIGSARKK
jgi:hypothetical protein